MSKASLETLARTMSIGFLAIAVIAIGKEQVQPASAATTVATVKVTKQKLNSLPLDESVRQVKASRTKAFSKKAPKDLTQRGKWLKEVLYRAGFRGSNLKTAWAVVMKESRGNPTSHNTNTSTGDNSYGLFQINMLGSLGTDRREKFGITTNSALFDPIVNAEAAYYMSARGTDWSSWDIDASGYNGGVSASSYRYWLAKYPKG